jgi:hypothetical protein
MDGKKNQAVPFSHGWDGISVFVGWKKNVGLCIHGISHIAQF